MKQVYNTLTLKAGATNAGISKIEVAAKDWLTEDIKIDFSTGNVKTAISLSTGKSFIELQFAPLSYSFDEKPKTNKSGNSVETTILGKLNDVDDAALLVIETLRYSELIVIATDRKGRKRIVGNQEFGCLFSFSNKQSNNPNGIQDAQITIVYDSEYYSPYYII